MKYWIDCLVIYKTKEIPDYAFQIKLNLIWKV